MNFIADLDNKKKVTKFLNTVLVHRDKFLKFLRSLDKIIQNDKKYNDIVYREETNRFDIEIVDNGHYYALKSMRPLANKDYCAADTPDLVKEICARIGVDPLVLKEKGRKQEIVKPKCFVEALLKILTKQDYMQICRYFSDGEYILDHATLLHRVRRALPSYIYSKNVEVLRWIKICEEYYKVDIVDELNKLIYQTK
jgi:chromosomal replication initiation ATPase DnaA